MRDLNELRDTLRDYIRQPECPVDRCIALAESGLRMIRHRDMETTRQVTVTAGTCFANLPADFVELRRVTLEGEIISPVGAIQLRRKNASTGYTIAGNRIELSDTTDTSRRLHLTYYAQIPTLTEASPTNWLLTKFPAVYLHAALAECFGWDRDLEGENASRGRLGEAIALVTADHRSAIWSGNTPTGAAI